MNESNKSSVYNQHDRIGFRFIISNNVNPETIYGFTFFPGNTIIDMSKNNVIQDQFRQYLLLKRLYFNEHGYNEFDAENNIKIHIYLGSSWHFYLR